MAKKIPLYPRIDYAKKVAKEFLLKSQITSLPINPIAVCKQHGFTVKSVSEAENTIKEIDPFEIRSNPNCDAKTYLTSKGKYLIVYDEAVFSEGRIIWTIAHELAHIVLKHLIHFEQTEIHKGLTDRENKVLEKEADAFASEFLAPAEVLLGCKCRTKRRIIKLCGLSDEAAGYKEEYLKKYKPAEKYRLTDQKIFRQFYSFIHNKEFFHALHYKVCPVCKNYIFSPREKFCRICGREVTARTLMEGIIYNDGVEVRTSQTVFCPKCLKPQKQRLATCGDCGTALVNKCTNPSCNKRYDGASRYCHSCGAPTSFFSGGLLNNWENARERLLNHQLVNQLVELDQGTGRVFNEWPYVLNLIKENGYLPLYKALRDSIGKIDYDTLYVYSDYPSAKKMIEDDRIVSYIIKQIKISLKIPILEVLLLKVADDGTIFFEE
ncbi:MAG: ImmA/IrrE family metallo-endopeptidase [Syntrophomonadaceae bacterium]|jgi:Zn-dependent peptidase ImmA (M78 family)|nr:ImmA/IrrE family metallo-endopeptidase [Syntrophomonadaceae bacterium]